MSARDTEGLTTEMARERLARDGANEIVERRPSAILMFARKLWGLSAWLIEAIAVLSFVLHKYVDAFIALALLLVNAIVGLAQEQRASAAVAALRKRLQVTARALRDGVWSGVPARELVAGDVLRIRAGDFVPADGRIVDGAVRVDESALTGETREIPRELDEEVRSGSIVRRGEATVRVAATGARTFFGRTAQLVQAARPKLHVEKVVDRVVKWLFTVVGVLVAITIAGSLVQELPLTDVLPLALVLLMSAVPVALPVMFTVSMAIGSIELGRQGALLTRLSAVEDAANMDVLCADKTGTLTTNRLELVRAMPAAGHDEAEVVRIGALASSEADQDPIDLAFLAAARRSGPPDAPIVVRRFVPFSAESRRTEALVEIGGRVVRVVKGAVSTVAELCGLDGPARAALVARAESASAEGARVLAVARGDEQGTPTLVGLALLSDPPRADSKALIAKLRDLGVGVVVLTGDALPVARRVASDLGVGEIAPAAELHAERPASERARSILALGGFAEVYPEDKLRVVEALQSAGHVVGMTGDGVNDAPALRQAEVGIAVSGATDVAKGAASVVLTTEGLSSIVELVRIGRAVYQRVLTWIVNKVSVTILKAGFVVIAFLVTGRFVVSALAMVLLVFMTDFAKIALSTDDVVTSSRPESWNIGPLVGVAVTLGVVMTAEALAVLAIGWGPLGLARHEGMLRTYSFEVLLFFALFSILSVRERRAFWASRPSAALASASLAGAVIGASVGMLGIGELEPLSPAALGVVVALSAMLTLGVNDAVKRALLARIARHDVSSAGAR